MAPSCNIDRRAPRPGTSFAIRSVIGLGLPLALLGMALLPPALASVPAGSVAAAAASLPGSASPVSPAVERFMLNVLLAPAFDLDQQPLVWADPRPRLICAAGTRVRIDGAPLRNGDLVPERPFRMSWDMRECRPFGIAGPRFDGLVDLHVVREPWGFSARIEPEGLIVMQPDGTLSRPSRSRATMPQQRVDGDAAATRP